jgi:hypothetical protein
MRIELFKTMHVTGFETFEKKVFILHPLYQFDKKLLVFLVSAAVNRYMCV